MDDERKRCVSARDAQKEDESSYAEPLLKRCGPILSEFPALGSFFKTRVNDKGKVFHVCAECSFETQNKTTLLYHALGVHLQLQPFACTQDCGMTCASYSNMRQHELRAHQVPYDKPDSNAPDYYVCEACKKRFGAPLNLVRHYFAEHMSAQPRTDEKTNEVLDESPGAATAPVEKVSEEEVRRRARVKHVMSISHITNASDPPDS